MPRKLEARIGRQIFDVEGLDDVDHEVGAGNTADARLRQLLRRSALGRRHVHRGRQRGRPPRPRRSWTRWSQLAPAAPRSPRPPPRLRPGTCADSPADADVFVPWRFSLDAHARRPAATPANRAIGQYYRRGETREDVQPRRCFRSLASVIRRGRLALRPPRTADHASSAAGSGGLPRMRSEAFSAIISTQALM